MPGLQEGPGLPGHLGGHRDYGGPGPVRQGFESLSVQGLPRRPARSVRPLSRKEGDELFIYLKPQVETLKGIL